jgi:hypothetical protein
MNRSIKGSCKSCDRLRLAGLFAVLIGGCTAISDLDRFEAVEDSGTGGGGRGGSGAGGDAGKGGGGKDDLSCKDPRTLCLQLTNYTPHLSQLVQVDLVTNDDNTLRTRAIFDPLGPGDGSADFALPRAIPDNEVPDDGEDHPLHLEIFADMTEDRMYTPNDDHDWNVELPASGTLVYPHNSDFSSLEPAPRGQGTDFTMQLTGMGVHMGVRLEVMVIQSLPGNQLGRTVGFYRIPKIAADTIDIRIPDIIDPGIQYAVEFYADANDNRKYDPPNTDHTWLETGESSEDGFHVQFAHGTTFADLEYQVEFKE